MRVGSDWQLLEGDALELLPGLEAESVDALVTDPPAGIGFMGKEWDGHKGGREAWVAWLASVMRECLRVLKPGAHGLVWALPRTSHWTGWALEEAGFEVRDRVAHLFGTGFPKSLDVSKAIDRAAGAEREVAPTIARQRGPCGEMHAAPRCLACGLTRNGTSCKCQPDSGPATPAAARWNGWGTALKPACEDWWLVRKPLSEGTVAANVLLHGVGALNVDGCRIEASDGYTENAVTQGINTSRTSYAPAGARRTFEPASGRWPANVTLDEEAARALDEMSGELKNGGPGGRSVGASIEWSGQGGFTRKDNAAYVGDSGGTSRFFYTAKADRDERDAGLEGEPLRVTNERDPPGSRGSNSPRAGAGRNGKVRNHHPTVKPVSLMRWLVRLITPPGGLILDPFAGSGTTGVAALHEGMRFLGMEKDAAYAAIARQRLEAWAEVKDNLTTMEARAAGQLALFG